MAQKVAQGVHTMSASASGGQTPYHELTGVCKPIGATIVADVARKGGSMATDTSFHSRMQEERQALRANWGWFLVLGAALVLAGLLAISYPVLATLTTVLVFGIVLMCGGGVEIASAIWARRWSGFFLHVLTGLLYLFVGFLLVERPELGAAGYTLLLAMFFIAGGLFRIVSALNHRFASWGWAALSGGVAVLLGIMIWRDWPEAALWVIGTFVGIDLLFNGLSWIMLGLDLRNLPAGKIEPGA
jgi:uncharacterized membrane protein HdeD (DUF308 family)